MVVLASLRKLRETVAEKGSIYVCRHLGDGYYLTLVHLLYKLCVTSVYSCVFILAAAIVEAGDTSGGPTIGVTKGGLYGSLAWSR